MLQQMVSDTCSETCAVELQEMLIILQDKIYLILQVTTFEIVCQDIDVVISFFVEYTGSSCVIAGCKHCHDIADGVL